MEFFDTHSHYNDEKFNEDRDEIIKKIYKEGITRVIVSGYDIESSKKAIELAEKYEFIYAICGISPNDVPTNKKDIDIAIQEIENISRNNKVLAIGEIGLDYYWNKENKIIQQEVFIKQIQLANKLNLPIVIHTRDAVLDTLDILKNRENANKKGVFHCCPLNRELVKEALKLNFYISFSGNITFKNSKNAKEVINQVPIEKILIETDCPYLAPEPQRGTRNDSTKIKYTAQKIAEVKQIELDVIAKQTYQNANNIFAF